jgi:hypothetical protein
VTARQKPYERRVKREPLEHLQYEGDPLEGKRFSEDPLGELNDLIKHTGAAIKKARAKFAAEAKKKVSEEDQHVRHQHRDIKAWTDVKFYTVVVFDAGNQCTAFIDALKVKCHLSAHQDLFLDGRDIADALGIELPLPDYQLKSHRTDVKKALTKRLARKGED